MPPVPNLAYGQVLIPDGKPAVGALVRAWLVDEGGNESEPLSAVVDGYGYWSLNLPVQDCEGVQLKLEAIGQRGAAAEQVLPACEVRPAVTIKLPAESPVEDTTLENVPAHHPAAVSIGKQPLSSMQRVARVAGICCWWPGKQASCLWAVIMTPYCAA